MVKLWHDIPMGALFYAHPAGVVSVLSIQPAYEAKQQVQYIRPRKDWKYYHKKSTLPSMKRTGCQKLHIMKI